MGAMADQKPEGAGETPPHSSEDEAITKVRTLDIPTKLETVRSNVPVKLQINIGMKGSEVIDACAKFANKNISISKVIDTVHRLVSILIFFPSFKKEFKDNNFRKHMYRTTQRNCP